MLSESELVEILDTMLPYPVDSFRGLVAEIGGVEVSAEEQDEDDAVSVGRQEIVHLFCLLFAALVRVGEIAGGFRFDENGR